ncbi:hypothetical protein Tco_0288666, partial [Tanacetum coccineum]
MVAAGVATSKALGDGTNGDDGETGKEPSDHSGDGGAQGHDVWLPRIQDLKACLRLYQQPELPVVDPKVQPPPLSYQDTRPLNPDPRHLNPEPCYLNPEPRHLNY